MPQYLLDTNTISTKIGRRPNSNALAWLEDKANDDLFLSALTIGELRKGAEVLRHREPRRSAKLNKWIDGLEIEFGDRILPVTSEIATRWGIISADRTRPIIDTLIAATALEHKLVVATRNTKDFQGLNVNLVNPFEVTD